MSQDTSEFKRDILIYFTVIFLTATIIGISYLRLGNWGIALMVAIATFEVVMVGYYFMHLMTKKKTIHLVLLLTVIVFINLLFWPAWDVLYSPRTPSDYRVN